VVNRLLGDFEPPTFVGRGLLVAVIVTACGLSGCGRKGGLDAPPMAAAGDLQPGQAGSAVGPDGKPVDPATQKRSRPLLDWLIN
jgi:hypothetical protein